MDRDEIIRMAREAGGMFDHMMWVNRDLAPVFERFDELVRADEREACAKVCDSADKSTHPADLADAIRARGQDPMPLFDDWNKDWK